MATSRVMLLSIPVMIALACLLALQRYDAVRKERDIIKEEQALKERTLSKYLSLIAEKPALETRIAALKEVRKEEETKLTQGQTVAIVAASLQDTVRTIVTGRGGTISSERSGKTDELGPFKVINVTIDTVLPDARALADVLYAIETRTPYLVVKDLDVRVRNIRTPKELTVKLDVATLTATK